MKILIPNKIILTVICLLCSLFFTASVSSAAKFDAKIEKIMTASWLPSTKASPYRLDVSAINGEFAGTRAYFIIKNDNTDGYYATALTAFSMGQPLRLVVSDIQELSLITTLIVYAPDN
jgi:hypothetical protein